jgi:hypothetical protein
LLQPKKFTLKELQEVSTIEQGHFDNLKYEGPLPCYEMRFGKYELLTNPDLKFRIWLSRMTKEDGMPYDNQVTVEVLENGNWKEVDQYQAK